MPVRKKYIREYMRKYRKLNPKRIAAIAKKRYLKNVALLDAAKKKPCTDCGGNYPPYVLDFHHVRGRKKFTIGMKRGASWKTLEAEIKKCHLLCANCHRERTFGGRK